MTQQEKRRDSVHRKGKGFTVSASPMNGVKFELGVILMVALLFWLVVERVTDDSFWKLLSLLLYGVVAMAWLIFRTRQVLVQSLRRHQGGWVGSGHLVQQRLGLIND